MNTILFGKKNSMFWIAKDDEGLVFWRKLTPYREHYEGVRPWHIMSNLFSYIRDMLFFAFLVALIVVSIFSI